MTTSAFRHHDDVPPQISSPLYGRLVAEWVSLNQLPSTTTAVAAWGRLEPALSGHVRPADLIDAVDAGPPGRADTLLLALIRLTQNGYQLAGRVVLHAMLPKLGRMTRRTSAASSDDAWAEDRRHIAVAALWDVIVSYPTQRRPTKVAANLALDTLNTITAGTRSPAREVPTDPTTLAATNLALGTSPLLPELTADVDLAELLTWAIDQGIMTPEDADLLRLVYTPDGDEAGPRSQAASRKLGLTPAAVRQRCARTRRRLTLAARAELTEEGHQTA